MPRRSTKSKTVLIQGSSVDPDRAQMAIEFFHSVLTHTKGELGGKPFMLQEWQQSYIARLFGTLNADGMRTVRTSLLALPRKNGKSSLCAGIAVKLLLENELEPLIEILIILVTLLTIL